MSKNLSVIFSSHFSDTENQIFINHLKSTAGIDIHVECIVNMNQYSLTQAYNLGWLGLDERGLGDGIVVFCHNDIKLMTKNWGKKLINFFKIFPDYDILGIAGSTELNEHGCWWLDNAGQMNTKKMFGRVWHTNGLRNWESIYSEKIDGIQEVVVVDGVFFAVNGETIIKRFNEEYKGFHYYDVSFCFENYLEGCNIGVFDKISILHQSIGQTNKSWDENRQQFILLNKEELPIIII